MSFGNDSDPAAVDAVLINGRCRKPNGNKSAKTVRNVGVDMLQRSARLLTMTVGSVGLRKSLH